MAAIGIGIGSAMTEQVLSFGGGHAFTVLFALLGAAALGIAASAGALGARRPALWPATARLRPAVLPH